jgi:arginine utilization protein RocB
VTLVVTAWEWLENLNGIFHDGQGTNQRFVYDTAISWLLPTFLQSTVILCGIHFL